MSFDTDLLGVVRALPDVQSICVNKRLYHQEVLQADTSFNNFPCIEYSLLSDEPLMELAGPSGKRQATFEFNCYSKLTSDTRTLSAAIQGLTGNGALAGVLEWIEAQDTTDSFDMPVDFDEKGLKAAQVTVMVIYTP